MRTLRLRGGCGLDHDHSALLGHLGELAALVEGSRLQLVTVSDLTRD